MIEQVTVETYNSIPVDNATNKLEEKQKQFSQALQQEGLDSLEQLFKKIKSTESDLNAWQNTPQAQTNKAE